MALQTIKVTLVATVNRAAWVDSIGDEPEVGVAAYVLDTVRRQADRLVELGARVFLTKADKELPPDVSEPWPSTRVTLLIEVDNHAWAHHYGRSAEVSVPPYVAHVVWLATPFTKDNGTVELVGAG